MPIQDVLPRNFYTDLVQRYNQQTKKPTLPRVDITRPGVDYGTFYESLGLVGEASRAATDVTRQQAANTAASQYLAEQQELARLAEQEYDLSNVVPRFTGVPSYQTGGKTSARFANLPLRSYRVTSGFGPRHSVRGSIRGTSRYHTGIDLASPVGTPIYATHDGQVTFSGWNGLFGNTVKVAGGGAVSQYSHNSRNVVRPGDYVRAGQLIGYVGATGNVTGPHLHYELSIGDRLVDPRSYQRF